MTEQVSSEWEPNKPSVAWAEKHHPEVNRDEVTEHFILWCRENDQPYDNSVWRTFISNDGKRLSELTAKEDVVAPVVLGDLRDQRTTGKRWQPSAPAMRTARDRVKIVDIPIHITRYTVVCQEKQKQPSSSEWLRWILADEQRAVSEQKKEEHDGRKDRSWYSVAD